jgi:hypothetical protein
MKHTRRNIEVQVIGGSDVSGRGRQDVWQPSSLEQGVSPRLLKSRVAIGHNIASQQR